MCLGYFIKGMFAVIIIFRQFYFVLEKFEANFAKPQIANSVFIYPENGAVFDIM